MGRPERTSTKVRTCKHEQAILGIQCKLVQVGRGTWGECIHARSERMGTDAVMLQPAGPLTPAQWSQRGPCLPSSAFSDFISNSHDGNIYIMEINKRSTSWLSVWGTFFPENWSISTSLALLFFLRTLASLWVGEESSKGSE